MFLLQASFILFHLFIAHFTKEFNKIRSMLYHFSDRNLNDLRWVLFDILLSWLKSR
jgi:hypothetical protein